MHCSFPSFWKRRYGGDGKAGLSRATGATGAVTLVQRFGSALNLNVHFHMVFLDGPYQTVGADAPVFRPVAAPESSDLQQLVEQIAGRIGRALERRGLSLCASSHRTI